MNQQADHEHDDQRHDDLRPDDQRQADQDLTRQKQGRQEHESANFETMRPQLWAAAYRMLGSVADAEDVVQDCYLKWAALDRETKEKIENQQAWLMTVCTRRAIDLYRAAQRQRTDYIGFWLPEPVLEGRENMTENRSASAPLAPDLAPGLASGLAPGLASDFAPGLSSDMAPDEAFDLSATLSTAFLLLLERLTPLERAAYILHHIFDYDYAEIATLLGREEAACRKLVSRAKAHIETGKPRQKLSQEKGNRFLEVFMTVLRSGDIAPLAEILAEDAELMSDGGGKVAAALNVISSRENIARFIAGLMKKFWQDIEFAACEINNDDGVVFSAKGNIVGALWWEYTGDKITQIYIMRNPDKLTHFIAAAGRNSNNDKRPNRDNGNKLSST